MQKRKFIDGGAAIREPPDLQGRSRCDGETGLAVVYPALSRGDTAAGPDGIRGSATGQMDELSMARIISLASAEPGLTGSPSLCVTLASRRRFLFGAVPLMPPERQSFDMPLLG
jgi:hypothetical protein